MSIVDQLVEQAPGLAGSIIIVVLFLRSIKERDILFAQVLKEQRDSFNAMLVAFGIKIDSFENVLLELDGSARSAMGLDKRKKPKKKYSSKP